MEKPRGYHGEWSPYRGFKAKNPRGRSFLGFLVADLPRDSIHHDIPKAFPHNILLSSTQTIIWDFCQPMEPLGNIMVNIPPRLLQTLTVLNTREGCRKNIQFTYKRQCLVNSACHTVCLLQGKYIKQYVI